MRAIPLLTVLLLGCSDGPSPETLIDELRIVAAVAEPAEVGPGEEMEVSLTVADPKNEGFDLLVFTCPSVPCVPDMVAVVDPENPVFSVSPQASTTLWTLACTPGTCDLIDDAATALEAGTPETLASRLAFPDDELSGLPLDGVSAATKSLVVSDRPEGERNVNPILDVEIREDGGAIELDATVDEEATAYPYATAGGFTDVSTSLPGVLRWLAAKKRDEPDSAVLYVVAEDGEGGTAVWTGSTP